jgi:hypothetical protein
MDRNDIAVLGSNGLEIMNICATVRAVGIASGGISRVKTLKEVL